MYLRSGKGRAIPWGPDTARFITQRASVRSFIIKEANQAAIAYTRLGHYPLVGWGKNLEPLTLKFPRTRDNPLFFNLFLE